MESHGGNPIRMNSMKHEILRTTGIRRDLNSVKNRSKEIHSK